MIPAAQEQEDKKWNKCSCYSFFAAAVAANRKDYHYKYLFIHLDTLLSSPAPLPCYNVCELTICVCMHLVKREELNFWTGWNAQKKIERVQWGNTIKTESMVLSMERMGKCW